VKRPEGTPGYREGELRPLRALVGSGATDAMPRDHVVLRWEGGPPGAAYDVRVLDTELRLLHEANGLAGAELAVPAAALAAVPDGATLLWQVDARVGDQRVSSPTFRLRLP
jgi:hypothetical protein